MVRVNLLPIRGILRKRELKQFFIMAGIALGIVLGLMGATYAMLTHKVTGLEQQERVTRHKLNELKKKNTKIAALKNRINSLKKQVKTINRLTKTRDTPASFMEAVAHAVPNEVWINNISKNGRRFSLSGAGTDNIVVVNFVERLQKLRKNFTPDQLFINPESGAKEKSYFRGVRLGPIVQTGGRGGLGTVSFTITGAIR